MFPIPLHYVLSVIVVVQAAIIVYLLCSYVPRPKTEDDFVKILSIYLAGFKCAKTLEDDDCQTWTFTKEVNDD